MVACDGLAKVRVGASSLATYIVHEMKEIDAWIISAQ